jgi:MULE transposase domain
MRVDLSAVKEVFIDATFNTSKVNSHLYAIVAQELGYGIPLAFMLMEIHSKEDTRKKTHEGEALQCNENFFRAARELGLDPTYVHTDKDWAEINAAKVPLPCLSDNRSFSSLVD